MNNFSISQKQRHYIVSYNSKPIKGQFGKDLFISSVEEAELLIKDYNDNYKGKYAESKSFVYCFLSITSAVRDFKNKKSRSIWEFDLEFVIQWDKVFRLNPAPLELLWQLNHVQCVKDILKDKWVDMPLNYYPDLESLPEDERVPNETYLFVQGLLDSLPDNKRLAAQLVFEYYQKASVVLPILWALNKITTEDLVGAMTTLTYSFYAKPLIDCIHHPEKITELDEGTYLEMSGLDPKYLICDLKKEIQKIDNLKELMRLGQLV